MELDWSTFLLEIINFLILVWILQRFLYKPVMGVVARRQASIEQSIARAREQEAQAKTLTSRYESRLQVWELEREKARAALREEVAAERTRMLTALHEEVDRERARAVAIIDKQKQAEVARAEGVALEQSTRFLSRLLERLATPALESRLVEVTIQDLADLGADGSAAVRNAHGEGARTAAVSTAFLLPAEQRSALQSALESLLGTPLECEFSVDPTLIAGVRVTLGPWSLRANLGDELKAFSDAAVIG